MRRHLLLGRSQRRASSGTHESGDKLCSSRLTRRENIKRPTNNLRLSFCVYCVEPIPFFAAGVLGVHLRTSRRADAESLAGERSREPAPRKRRNNSLRTGGFLLADPREQPGDTETMISERKRRQKWQKTHSRHRKSQGERTGRRRRWEGEGEGGGHGGQVNRSRQGRGPSKHSCNKTGLSSLDKACKHSQ